MIVIAVLSGKGGVGKTTLTFEFAHLLAERYRTLAVDLDSQASLSACFGVATRANIAQAMSGRATMASITQLVRDRLSLVPSGVELAGVELSLASRPRYELILKQSLASVAAAYDVAIIDCPPALGLLISNALAASDGALIVAQPEAMNLTAIQAALDAVAFIKSNANPNLEIIGVLVNEYAGYINHHAEAVASMKSAGLPLLKTTIPRTVRLAEIPVKQKPLTEFDGSHGAALALTNAYQELQRWLKNKSKRVTGSDI